MPVPDLNHLLRTPTHGQFLAIFFGQVESISRFGLECGIFRPDPSKIFDFGVFPCGASL